jgi:signal transduction histidine kinase
MTASLGPPITLECAGERFDLADLPLPVLVCAADGSLRGMTPAARTLLGADLPPGPGALAALLTAAGVDDAARLLAAALDADQVLQLRRGGDRHACRLRGSRSGDGSLAYVVLPLPPDAAGTARRAEFQSLVAHDLRSPLAVIQGYAGLLATGQAGPLTTTQQEFLTGIDGKIGELVRLLDDFLDYHRCEAGALTLAREPVPLGEMVDRLVEEYGARAARRGLQLDGEVAPGDLHVDADPLRLRQVLDNLVGNAVKYADDGTWIRVTATARGPEAEIVVADGGPGLSAADLSHLFLPYRRGDGAERVRGAGLGLVVVSRLVESHGGRIVAESPPGAGARFVIHLPQSSHAGDVVR